MSTTTCGGSAEPALLRWCTRASARGCRPAAGRQSSASSPDGSVRRAARGRRGSCRRSHHGPTPFRTAVARTRTAGGRGWTAVRRIGTWPGGSGTRTSSSCARRPGSTRSCATTSPSSPPAAAASRACAPSTTSAARRSTSAPPRAPGTASGAARAATSSASCARSTTSRSPRPSRSSPGATASPCATPRAAPAPDRQAGNRSRLVEAHKAAAAFYVERLASPEAEIGRRFLTERGFDAEAAAHFGVGYAPKGWDVLLTHLRGKGFTDDQLVEGGLVARGGQRGIYDRFRGRLVWPIRDTSGDVVGFGARKLYDDDEGPKYLNTPETPLYKKSQVLYGIDLARKDIAKRKQAVIVEGYTDVMAAHLSGVDDRGRHLRHVVRLRPHQRAAPPAHGRRRLHRRGRVHLRRRRRRAEGRAARVRRGPAVHRPDLRRRRAERHGPVRAAHRQGPGGRARAGRAQGAAVRVRDPHRAQGLRPRPRRGPHRRPARRGARRRPHPRRGAAPGVRPPGLRLARACPTTRCAVPCRPRAAPSRRQRADPPTPGARPSPADAGAVPRLPRPDPRDKVAERRARGAQGRAAGAAARGLLGRRARDRRPFRSPAYVAVHRAIVAAGRRGRRARRPRVARRRARRLPRRRRARGGARARGRPAADRRGRRALRAVGDRAAARDRRLAAHHRPQGAAPAHRAGHRPRRLPGAVRRRARARGLPPRAARAGRRRRRREAPAAGRGAAPRAAGERLLGLAAQRRARRCVATDATLVLPEGSDAARRSPWDLVAPRRRGAPTRSRSPRRTAPGARPVVHRVPVVGAAGRAGRGGPRAGELEHRRAAPRRRSSASSGARLVARRTPGSDRPALVGGVRRRSRPVRPRAARPGRRRAGRPARLARASDRPRPGVLHVTSHGPTGFASAPALLLSSRGCGTPVRRQIDPA